MMEKTQLNEHGFAISTGWLTVYRTNEITGEYIGVFDAHLVETTGCAANDYPDAPPEYKPGFAIIRTTKGWSQVEDHRGSTVYRTTNGQEVVVTWIGPITAEYTDSPRPSPYHDWDAHSQEWIYSHESAETAALNSANAELTRRIELIHQHKTLLQDAIEGGWSADLEQDNARLVEWKKTEYAHSQLKNSPGWPYEVVWPEMPQ